MTTKIQMVWTGEDNCLFIYGINENTELIFRTTRIPKHLRNEHFEIHENKCYVASFHFSKVFLNDLPIIE